MQASIADPQTEEVVSLEPTGGIRLNLGCGPHRIEGWVNIDRDDGTEAFPLTQYADGSVDEVRASHILEHFSFRDTTKVLTEWHRVLKPGGRIRIAVPDFDVIVDKYKAGSDPLVETYIVGSHSDQNDLHGAIFTETKLRELLQVCGFVKVRKWESDIKDCASLPVSLNLCGVKVLPSSMDMSASVAVASLPRLGFNGHSFCVANTIRNTGMRLITAGGAWWHHGLDRLFERAVEDEAEFVMAIDYDTVWQPDDAVLLHDFMRRHPEVDAIAPLQLRRGDGAPLAGLDIRNHRREGDNIAIDREYLVNNESTPVRTAHFGLTLIRVSSLKKMPRPWFSERPNTDGSWGAGGNKLDADIWFWREFEKAGLKLHMSNRVAVGHIEEICTWPDVNCDPIFDYLQNFEQSGPPQGVWR